MAILNRTLPRSRAKAAAETPRLRLRPVLLISGVALTIIAVLQVVQTSQATTANFAIQDLAQQRLELQAQVRQLEAEVAGLSSLTRIEAEAKRLGLEQPQGTEAVEVNVAWAGASVDRLPTRYALEEQAPPVEEDADSPWWRDLLDHLPFN